jgi:multiple antibiotic resistance protein
VVDAAKDLLLILSALFPIVNPLGGSPIFLSLTREYSPQGRRSLSLRIARNSLLLIIGSYFFGTHVLAAFGISIPVVQVGGGLVVISTAWAMLKRRDEDERTEVLSDAQRKDPFRQAFYPLTLPLTVGPGSISVAITLGANAARHGGLDPWTLLAAFTGAVVIAASIYVCYAFADRVATVLGPSAMTVIMRLSSFLLVCIGVQILWNGVSALLASVPFHTR